MSCQCRFSFATRVYASRLDAPPFGRPATVVRDGRYVLDGIDVKADAGKSTDGRLAAGTRALYADFNSLDPVLIAGSGGGSGGSLLRSVWRALARTLKTDGA